MKRIAVLGVAQAIAFALLGTPGAQAHTTIACEPCSAPYQRWVDEARVPTPEVTLTVVESPCLDGARACIAPWDAVLWLDPGSATREDFLHEVGHAEDYFALPDWMRWRFMSLLVLTGEWNPQPETQFSPAEQFADVYAECAVVPYIDRKQRLGPGPVFGGEPIGGRVTHNRICRMLARA